jgi:lipopolysaccharide export system protein LptC
MAADSRSRAVRALKLLLPAAALALTVTVFVLGDRDEGFSLSDVDFSVMDGLRLSNPEFTGRMPDGSPFSITAEWAIPDGPDPERVELGPMRGEARLADGRVARLRADGGDARPKAETLTLEGDVATQSSDGWSMRVPRADLDLGRQTMRAAGPVRGEAPFGEIDAGSMRAARIDESHYIWFEDGVRVRIDPSKAPRQGE